MTIKALKKSVFDKYVLWENGAGEGNRTPNLSITNLIMSSSI